MTEKGTPEDLLEFPCDYLFKALGVADEAFKQAIIAAVKQHVPVSVDSIRSRPSGKGKYQSVSILVRLYNYGQLTSVYAEMRQVEGLKMLL